ncbi:porin [Lutibaculum baratangense]|uniref:Porin n=1 Tax=Lutibaculum baratangense AMV1 TaxID=631454 RepID=V4RCV0_9HYPH|nr:porin [Lutibaculum baratangense]ESR23224.1 hypothetical protein N177_3292 [Lutibaculum baratangense AMV1]
MKSFFLGSAFAVVAATGAQAADPILYDVKAPREPVYRCDTTGFFEIPGTDVCLKIGGFAAAVAYGGVDWEGGGTVPFAVRYFGYTYGNTAEGFNIYARGRINFDARTATEYGTVRAFMEFEANTAGSGNTGNALNTRHAYVQFGNWTFGKTNSVFTDGSVGPDGTDPFTILGTNTTRINQIRYTQAFGNGMSVSVSLEDSQWAGGSSYYRAYDPDGFRVPAGVAVVDNDWPVVVAGLKYAGDWGSAHLAGAIGRNEIEGFYEPLGLDFEEDEIGWAITASLSVNVPSVGEDTSVNLKGIYTDGLSRYAGPNALGRATSYGVGWCDAGLDSICLDSDIQVWSVLGFLHHSFSDRVAGEIGASYQNTQADRYFFIDDEARNLDVDAWEVFANVSWTPVSRTTFIADVHYGNISQDFFNPDNDQALAFGVEVIRSF